MKNKKRWGVTTLLAVAVSSVALGVYAWPPVTADSVTPIPNSVVYGFEDSKVGASFTTNDQGITTKVAEGEAYEGSKYLTLTCNPRTETDTKKWAYAPLEQSFWVGSYTVSARVKSSDTVTFGLGILYSVTKNGATAYPEIKMPQVAMTSEWTEISFTYSTRYDDVNDILYISNNGSETAYDQVTALKSVSVGFYANKYGTTIALDNLTFTEKIDVEKAEPVYANDFESNNVGDSFSGTEQGLIEQVTDEVAFAGTKALKFEKASTRPDNYTARQRFIKVGDSTSPLHEGVYAVRAKVKAKTTGVSAFSISAYFTAKLTTGSYQYPICKSAGIAPTTEWTDIVFYYSARLDAETNTFYYSVNGGEEQSSANVESIATVYIGFHSDTSIDGNAVYVDDISIIPTKAIPQLENNLSTDADFEGAYKVGGTGNQGVSLAQTCEEAYSGAYSLKATGISDAYNRRHFYLALKNHAALSKDGTYQIEVMAASPNHAQFGLSMMFNRNGLAYPETAKAMVTLGHEWTKYTFVYSIRTDGDTIYYSVNGGTENSNTNAAAITTTYFTVNLGAEGDIVYIDSLVIRPYVEDKFTEASITLGSDISLNFYATTLSENPRMRFTMNGASETVEGVSVANDKYRFTYKGLAPQNIGDQVTAELLSGEKILATKTYSILEYCMTQYNNEDASESLKTLIADLLDYGAAAQKCLNPTLTDEQLVNYGITGASEFESLEATDAESIKGTEVAGVAFTVAGLRFDYNNKLYFRFTAPSLDGIKVLIDDVDVTAYAQETGDGVYTVYTQDVKAKGFETVYTAELYSGETLVHTVKYSVKSFVFAKQNGDDAVANLARALYKYGVSAKNYQ